MGVGVGRKLGRRMGQPSLVVVVGHILGHMERPLVVVRKLVRMGRPLGVVGVACILGRKLGLGPFRILACRLVVVVVGASSWVGRELGHMGRPLGRMGPQGRMGLVGHSRRLVEVVAQQDLIRIPLLAQPQPLELGWGVLEVLVLVG